MFSLNRHEFIIIVAAGDQPLDQFTSGLSANIFKFTRRVQRTGNDIVIETYNRYEEESPLT